MRYFKNKTTDEVFAFDEDEQAPYIEAILSDPETWQEVTGSWPPVIPPPTQEELIAIASEAVRFALQEAIDTKARELGFSGGNALMLYVGFENAFQPIAQVFASWEANVWVEAGAYKAQVIAGTAPMLTPEEAVAQMPELVMP